MQHTHMLSLGILCLTIFSAACQEPTSDKRAIQQSQASARHDLMQAKYVAEENIYRAVSQDEWQAFKMIAESKLDDIDLQIASIDRSVMPPDAALTDLYFRQIDSLQLNNTMLKSSIIAYNERQSEWAGFMQAFEKNVASTELALKAFLPR